MEKIILYSTGCPRCEVLKRKLYEKGVDYEINTDTDLMAKLGFDEVPMLQVGNDVYGFGKAVEFINQYDKKPLCYREIPKERREKDEYSNQNGQRF